MSLLLCLTDVKNRWEKSSWGRKLIVQKRRASLNDFDRFKIMLAKIKVSFTKHAYSHCFDFGIAPLIVCELVFMFKKNQGPVLVC